MARFVPVWSGFVSRWRISSRRLVVAGLLIAAVIWHPFLERHLRPALFISESFPQVPLKPLQLVSTEPLHQTLQLGPSTGGVVADLYVPTQRFGSVPAHSRPALVLAMGVKTSPEDRPLLLELARTLARLGCVVLWSRSQSLDDGVSLPEEPDTFVSAVRYLQSHELVDPQRISLLGFSTGASTGFVAASRPEIADNVRSLIFFGGYFDIHDYLLSLATASMSVNGHSDPWPPSEAARGQVQEILANTHSLGLLRAFDAATPDEAAAQLEDAPKAEIDELRRFSPSFNSNGFRGRLFILHDTGDPLVPYVESAKLYQAMSSRVETTYVVTSLFEHVQPKKELTWETVGHLLKLYAFLDEALHTL